MSLTLRQWIIVIFLATAFIVAAVLIANDGSERVADTPTFDESAWCQSANAVSRWGGILDLEAGGANADDIENLYITLQEAQLVAPPELFAPMARLLDLVLLTRQELDELSVADALVAASAQTDAERVREALDEVNQALVECGTEPAA